MKTRKTKCNKYSPLWYAALSMKAFCNGDHMLANRYYAKSQEILDFTGSMFLPLPQDYGNNELRIENGEGRGES